MNQNWLKPTILFLLSQTMSLFGSSLVQYAIMWYITLKTQSGAMMTISIICGFLPMFFLSPFAGVWADRYNRKILIILSDSLIALATLVAAILFFLGYDMLWLLFVVSAIRAVGGAIQMPAVGAFLPQLVPTDMLTKVNAVNGSIQSLVLLVSPMLSAALLTISTIEVIFLVDVVTAAMAVAVLLLFLHVPAHQKAAVKPNTGYLDDFKEGLKYINHHGYVKKLFLFTAVFFILVTPVSFLTPLQVTRSFGADVWRLTAIEVLFSIGMTVGGIILAYWGGFRNKIYSMTLSTLVIGACTLALGITPVFGIYLFFMALAGIAIPIFNTPFTVLLQERIEADILGRVFGVLGMISSAMMPLAMLFFGPLADIIDIEWLLMGSGLLIFVEGLFLFSSIELLEAGQPILQTVKKDL